MNNNAMKCTETDAAATSLRGDCCVKRNDLADVAHKLTENCDELTGTHAVVKGELREMDEILQRIEVKIDKIASDISQLKWMIVGMYVMLFALIAQKIIFSS